jgi:serine protease
MAYQEQKQNRQPVREGKERPLPINLRKTSTEVDKTGFIVLRMSGPVPSLESLDLKELARVSGFSGLSSVLEKHPQVPSRRLISSKSPKELENIERISSSKELRPLGSLTQFWRLDCRNIPEEIKTIAQELKLLKEVDLVYLENAVSLPASPIANPYSAGQGYLDEAPAGINAKWAWAQTNGDGAGVAFVDLEQGWFLDHEDLAAKTPTLIFNNVAPDLDSRYHGTAVLGEVIGVNNNKGVVGVANGVTSVRLVSYYDSATNSQNVADAIRAATDVMTPGDVLLLEVQIAQTRLPTETDPAVFVAIQRAVAHGIIVVEAA